MKLKKVDKDDYMKCCRWCKHFRSGKCYNRNMVVSENINVYKVSEDGHVSETLVEVFESADLTPFQELEFMLLEWGVSKKRVGEFNKQFRESYERFALDIVPEIDEKVSVLFQNKLSECNNSFDGIDIEDPEEFICKDWC